MAAVKYSLIALAAISQLAGIVFLFIEMSTALLLFGVYGISLVVLLLIFIRERRIEKKEEINYDDCDY